MPWFNVELKDGFEDNIAKEFELNGSVPKNVIFNSKGIIIEDKSHFYIEENLDSA